MTSTILEMQLKGRKLPKRRFPKMTTPLRVERDYLRQLYHFTDKLYEIISEHLITRLPNLLSEQYMNRPDNARQDAADDGIKAALQAIKTSMNQAYSEQDIRRIAQMKGIEVAEFNEQVIKKGLQRVAGVDLLLSQPYLAGEMALFTSQNALLISSLKDETLRKVETLVYEGMRAGTRVEELAKEVRKFVDPDVGNVRARAKLIARDQVSKLNGQLTYLRQAEMGVRRYVWRTSGDERVRASHQAKEGQIYSWNSPPADTGHPGEDYQCRCTAEPFLGDLVEGL